MNSIKLYQSLEYVPSQTVPDQGSVISLLLSVDNLVTYQVQAAI